MTNINTINHIINNFSNKKYYKLYLTISFLFLYFDETKLYNMTTAISIITLVIVFIIWLILNGLYKLFKDLNRKIDSLKFRIENPDIKDQIVIKRNYEKN